MPRSRVFVLGAGLSGLAAAWTAGTRGVPVTLIERDEAPGGLATTISWDEWKFDLGPHNFHSPLKSIIEFYGQALGDDFLPRVPRAALYFRGRTLRYPLRGLDVFSQLGATHAVRAAFSFLNARYRAAVHGLRHTPHFDEWIVDRFGTVLYEAYFGPYVRRVWRLDPHDLSSLVGERRIPVLSVRGYLKRELLRTKPSHPDDLENYQSFYPVGGIGRLADYFVSALRRMPNVDIRLGSSIEQLQLAPDGKSIAEIHTTTGSFDGRDAAVISTIPLERLVQGLTGVPSDVRRAAEGLDYCPERFLLVRMRRPQILPNDWTYFAGEDFLFNRVMELRAAPFQMAPQGHCSLTFELPANPDELEWSLPDDELLPRLLAQFGRLMPIPAADVIDCRSVRIAAAYPKFRVGYEEKLRSVFRFLHGIPALGSVGRQGLFAYINTDEATDHGFRAGSAAVEANPLDASRYLLKHCHNITE